MLDGEGKGVVEATGLLGEGVGGVENDGFDFGSAKFAEALAADLRVRIAGGDDATGDAGGDECFRAGTGAAVMRTGFERDVGCCAVDGMAAKCGVFESSDFSVVAGVVEVGAFADGVVMLGKDTADSGVR